MTAITMSNQNQIQYKKYLKSLFLQFNNLMDKSENINKLSFEMDFKHVYSHIRVQEPCLAQNIVLNKFEI